MKIYVISDNKGLYKIGVSSNSEKRKQGLQTGNGNILEIKYQSEDIDNAYKLESELHKVYEQNNSSNEWFEFSKEEFNKVSNDIDNLIKTKGIKEKQNKRVKTEEEVYDRFEIIMDKFYKNRDERYIEQEQMKMAKKIILQAKEFKRYINNDFVETHKEDFRKCLFGLMDCKDSLKGMAKELFSEIIENEINEIMITLAMS